ncbi:hypothetical protein DFH01_14735 [Falsiroseomonas bella]|uniref:Autotransporter domain-containing protein n=1 Tax=Falsiroseomonas bella TaxID=2184016 RepID=A0A317FD23_9PROT|nr:hypothetical protein DFH01_14735 [Falsiroseomonas bella]
MRLGVRAGPLRASALALPLAVLLPTFPLCAQPVGGGTGLGDIRDELAGRLEALRSSLRARPGGVLGLMGYSMVPDGSANAVQVDRSTVSGGSDDGADTTLTLSQFGFGFTWSEAFPLFTEIYGGYARYDPRAVFSGTGTRRTPLRWNNFTTTVGIGYDIRIAENLWLRPIVNFAGGYAAGDASLFAQFIKYRTDLDIAALTDRHVNVWGVGGALMLAYYDYRPERDIDVELRYTQLRLETFGDTLPAATGSSTAETIGLWARYRWPTGREVFGRPLRWVLDGSATSYLGDQREAIGFAWSAKFGGGIEFDTGRWELGAMGINLNRVRLIGRYFIGDDNITGYSIGIGMSF